MSIAIFEGEERLRVRLRLKGLKRLNKLIKLIRLISIKDLASSI